MLSWKGRMQHSHRAEVSTVPLTSAFYARNTVTVAQELLGKILVRELGATVLEGMIVETEAYRGRDDPASHAYRALTQRNEVMFGEPGRAYVYFTYGMHYCLNITTEPVGQAGAVLIRALQPIKGLAEMKRRRRIEHVKDLSNGPAKLTQAFAVTKALNGYDLTSGKELFVANSFHPERLSITAGGRIGIRSGCEKPWRFFVEGSPYVSKR